MGYIKNYSSLIWNSNITVNFVTLVAKSDNLITPEFIWLLFKLLPEGKKKNHNFPQIFPLLCILTATWLRVCHGLSTCIPPNSHVEAIVPV